MSGINIRQTSSSGRASGIICREIDGWVELKESRFEDIDNDQMAGALFFEQVQKVLISDVTLKNVNGYFYGAIYLSTKYSSLQNMTLTNVMSVGGAGGGIYFQTGFGSYNKFELINVDFTDVFAKNIGGGVIITSSFNSSEVLELKINQCDFINGQSETGSGVYIAETVILQEATIWEVTFQQMHTSLTAPIHDAHGQGLLVIQDAEFNDCTGAFGAIYAFYISDDKILKLDSLYIHDNQPTSANIFISSQFSVPSVQIYSCRIINNTGYAMQIANGTEAVDDSSEIQYNGRGVRVQGEATMRMMYTKIQYNGNVDVNGGGIYIINESRFECQRCEIVGNTGAKGGGVMAAHLSVIVFSDTKFELNSSSLVGSAAFIIGCPSTELQFTNCNFINNKAQGDGTISIIDSDLKITEGQFNSNTTESDCAGIFLNQSSLVLTTFSLSNQTSFLGAFLYASSKSYIKVQDCTFQDGLATDQGTIYSMQSDILIYSSTFKNITNGVLFLNSQSNLSIDSSQFTQCESDSEGSVIVLQNGQAYLTNVIVADYKQVAIQATDIKSITITNSTFQQGSDTALICISCEHVNISHSSFLGNKSKFQHGGGVNIASDSSPNTAVFYNVNFTDNSSSYGSGGAAYLDNTKATFTDCKFLRNSAATVGGAIHLACNDLDADEPCEYKFEQVEFTENIAEDEGGAVYWETVQPKYSEEVFNSNLAGKYGNNLASFPVQIRYYYNGEVQDFSNRRLEDDSDLYQRLYNTSIAPGQTIQDIFEFVLIDHYQNVVLTDIGSQAIVELINYDTGNQILGQFYSDKGLYQITDFSIPAPPDSEVILHLTTTSVDPDLQPYSLDVLYLQTIPLRLQLRNCQLGEFKTTNACMQCIVGTYNVDINDPCADCEKGAECLFDGLIFPKKEYWRSSRFSSIFYKCPNVDACLGSAPNYTNPKGDCEDGYKGNLCQNCENDYSHSTANTCNPCPSDGDNSMRLLGIWCIVVLIFLIFVHFEIKSALEPTQKHSIYLKIFANYFQLLVLSTELDLDWPSPIADYLNVQQQTGQAPEQLFSIDCFLQGNSDDSFINVYYTKIIVVSLAPYAISLIILAGFYLYALITANFKILRREMVSALIIVIFLILPSISKYCLMIFACWSIDGEGSYLEVNLDIECWNDEHLFYSYIFALPTLIIWSLVIPCSILSHIAKRRLKLNKQKYLIKFGFLYKGFRMDTYYWEFVIFFRKLAVIAVLVILIDRAKALQALGVLLVLLISLYLQYDYRPFENAVLNQMEVKAIMVSTVTIYCALFYLTDEFGDVESIILFLALVIPNIIFLIYWLYYMAIAGYELAKDLLFHFNNAYGVEFDETDPLLQAPLTHNFYFREGSTMYTVFNTRKMLKFGKMRTIKQVNFDLPMGLRRVFAGSLGGTTHTV